MGQDLSERLLDTVTTNAYRKISTIRINEYEACKYLGHLKNKERYPNGETEFICDKCYRLVKLNPEDEMERN